jgi:DNA relaxase NicK
LPNKASKGCCSVERAFKYSEVRMASIDYVSYIVKGLTDEQVLVQLGRWGFAWTSVRGSHGYRQAWATDGARVYFDGQPSMGVYVQLSGEGCARVSSHNYFQSWGAFVRELHEFGASFNRFDFAFDDKSGLIPADVMFKCLDSGDFVSQFRKVKCVEEVAENAFTSRTRYVGSIMSEKCLCVYDKRLERLAKGEADPGQWLRFELRFKGKQAGVVASWLIENPELTGADGFLRSVINFQEASGDSNQSRRKIFSWWEEFLQESEKIRVTTVKAVRTVEQMAVRFIKQHSATLAMLVMCLCEGGIKGKWLDDCIVIGWGRMSIQQRTVVHKHLGYYPGRGITLPL